MMQVFKHFYTQQDYCCENQTIFECVFSSLSQDLQGSESVMHPKNMGYSQPHNYSTAGSHQSSDQGSNSTSGEASPLLSLTNNGSTTSSAQTCAFLMAFFFPICQGVRLKGAQHRDPKRQNIMC